MIVSPAIAEGRAPSKKVTLAGARPAVVRPVGGDRADRHVAPAVTVEVAGEEFLAVRVAAIDAVDDRRRRRRAGELDRRRALAALAPDDIRLADLALQPGRVAEVVGPVAAARSMAIEHAARADLR